jgi:hypothetical protein
MASGGVEIPIEFVTQFEKALRDIDRFSKQAGTQLSGIGKQLVLPNLSAGLEIAEKVVHAFERIGEAFGEVISEAAETERVTSQLNQALKASGDYSARNVEAFKNMADELARTSRFDDDLILGQVRLAKQFNTTNQEASKLIRAAVDLAAATGEDLPTAVQQLGQTLDGTVGRVGQLIPSLQTLTAEQLRSGAAIDVVSKRFRGFAQSELTTFSGAMNEISKSFKDLQKAIGAPIVESAEIIEVFKAISDTFRSMAGDIKNNKAAIVDFVSNGILFAVQGFGILAQAIKIANESIYASISLIADAGKAFFAFKTRNLDLLKSSLVDAKDSIKGLFSVLSGNEGGNSAGAAFFDKLTKSAADLAIKIEKIQAAQLDAGKATRETAEGFDSLHNNAERFDLSIIGKLKSLQEELQKSGATPIETLQNSYNSYVQLLDDSYKHHLITQQQGEELLHALKKKYLLEEIKIQKDAYEQLAGQVQAVFQNPFLHSLGPNEVPKQGGSLNLSRSSEIGLARGLGGANAVLQGAQGASNLLGAAASAIGTALLGPAGQLLGPIVQQLAKGPAAVRQMVDEFAKALPALVDGLITGAAAFVVQVVKDVPLIIRGLIDGLPDVIVALVELVPELIAAIVEDVPQIIEAIVTKLPGALIKAIGKMFGDAGGMFASKVLQGATQFVGKMLEGAGQVIQKLIDGVTHPFGKKGTLFNFSGGGFGLGGDKGLLGGGIVSGILAQTGRNGLIADQPPERQRGRPVSGSHTIVVPVSVGRAQFAQAIVDVKRAGYRLEPI